MKQRTITGIFIAVAIVVAFLLRLVDVRLFDLCICAVAVVCAVEVTKALGDKLTTLQKWLVIIFAVTVFVVAVFFTILALVYAIVYILIALTLTILTFKQEEGEEPKPINFASISTLVFALVYPTLPLLTITLINLTLNDYSTFALLSLAVLTCVCDVAAYLFGSMIKGPKLAPSISPNKTISGAIAGVIASGVFSVVLYYVCVACGLNPFFGMDTFSVILFLVMSGLLYGVTSQSGDLFESAFKRSLGIKDTGSFLPGHGGMLDRVDSWTFTAVAIYLVYLFLY